VTPRLVQAKALDGVPVDEALRLAASLDQLSLHPFAVALVEDARSRGLELEFPTSSREHPGHGIEGTVGGHRVAVGSDALLRTLGFPVPPSNGVRALVGVDRMLAAQLDFADPPRQDAHDVVERLHAAGVVRVAMLTGDRREIAEPIGDLLGVDRVYADRTPADKLGVVEALRATPGLAPVVMVGDGINDAPALALADVGIAMGSEAATASSETADAVIVVDRIGRVADALAIGRRSLAIARQSVLAGIALSLLAMVAASFGLLTPLAGALLQEGIDVAVIANALRALRG
jgi:P-type E1-E2 ATPase